MNVVKFIGSWGCIIGAAVCIILLRDTGLATMLSIMAIAFATAPANA